VLISQHVVDIKPVILRIDVVFSSSIVFSNLFLTTQNKENILDCNPKK